MGRARTLLLQLLPTALVAEEVAWLRARHPGRVGLGVAAGALPLDFEVADIPQDESVARFKAELNQVNSRAILHSCRVATNPFPS